MRIRNSLTNVLFGLSGQLLSMSLGFIVRTVFIHTLGVQYLGVDGLFSSILMMLSLANLGFDTAIIYSLYQPLAEHDIGAIQALMNFYKKAYRYIGMVVLAIGLSLLPFLPHLINGKTTVTHLHLIYILFVLQSVSSYYFVYKQSIIIADQHNHRISKIHSGFIVLSNGLQILLLLATHFYIAVLSVQIVCRIMENIYIAHKANQWYPYIGKNNKAQLSKTERKAFLGNMYSLMLYKISGVVINGTDNIVISAFIGVAWVGKYANYLLILSTINTLLGYVFYSITASVGHLHITENAAKKYFIFRVMNFTNFWIFGLCTVCLWNLFNPFIHLWLGKQFVFAPFIVFAILLNFYTAGMQGAATTFRDTTGLFKKGKYRPVIAAIINIGLSIILVQSMGIAGVFLGTVFSRLCTYLWYDPYVIFKFVFFEPVKVYFLNYAMFGLLVVGSAFITEIVANLYVAGTVVGAFGSIAIKAALCLIIPNVIFYLYYRNSAEFNYIRGLVKRPVIP